MKNAHSLDWNAGNVETLTALLADGHSPREIAARLGTTRNAVLGKIHRLGLVYPDRPARPARPLLLRRPRKPKPLPFMARVKRTPPPEARGPVHFRELEPHHCRWMPGEPETQIYCGELKAAGSPYCSSHTRKAYARTASAA